MNTNSHAKRILCFGDSNTRGTKPWDPELGRWVRWSEHERWSGVLENKLGESYKVITDGVGGRLVNTQYHSADWPTEGLVVFKKAIQEHADLDLAIIMIGVNDARHDVSLNPKKMQQDLEGYHSALQNTHLGTNLLVINFPHLLKENYDPRLDFDKCTQIRALVQKVYGIENKNTFYLDADQVVSYSSQDGLHLDQAGHKALGQVVAEKVKEILE